MFWMIRIYQIQGNQNKALKTPFQYVLYVTHPKDIYPRRELNTAKLSFCAAKILHFFNIRKEKSAFLWVFAQKKEKPHGEQPRKQQKQGTICRIISGVTAKKGEKGGRERGLGGIAPRVKPAGCGAQRRRGCDGTAAPPAPLSPLCSTRSPPSSRRRYHSHLPS